MTDMAYLCWFEDCTEVVDVICNKCTLRPICREHSYNVKGASYCQKCWDKNV